MMRMLQNLTDRINLRKTCFGQLRKCSTVTKRNNSSKIETSWFVEREDEILNVVNKSNLIELTKYVQRSIAEKIILNRTADGPYKSLNELLSKNEIDSNVLNQFYALIGNHKMKQKKWKKFIVTPDIKRITIPSTIMGIHVGPTAITWTLIDINGQILDWDCIIWRKPLLKVNMFDLISLTSSVAQALPKSSSYVIEELPSANKNVYYMLSSQQQITFAISSCLKLIENQRKNDSSGNLENSIYVLQPLAAARFFSLLFGNEMIASEYITKIILNDAKTDKKELQNHFHVDDELKRKYTDREPEHKEQMGWSLLKALTFSRLLTMFNSKLFDKSNV